MTPQREFFIGSRSALVGLIAIFISAPVGARAAGEPAQEAPIAAADDALSFDLWRDLKEAGSHVGDRHNQWTLLGAGLAFTAARSGDPSGDLRAQAHFAYQHRMGETLEFVGNNVVGTGVPGILMGGAFWIGGRQVRDAKLVQCGQAHLEAIVVTSIASSVVKYFVSRERPDRDDRYSFPSAHTSTVFTSATVLTEFYGWKAAVPGYALGVVTALARVSANRHWLSDTVGGATVGLLVGHAFARAHLNRAEKSTSGTAEAVWMPVPVPGGAEVLLSVPWPAMSWAGES